MVGTNPGSKERGFVASWMQWDLRTRVCAEIQQRMSLPTPKQVAKWPDGYLLEACGGVPEVLKFMPACLFAPAQSFAHCALFLLRHPAPAV